MIFCTICGEGRFFNGKYISKVGVFCMFFNAKFPSITNRINKRIKWISMLIFLVFVLMAFLNNKDNFVRHVHLIVTLVIAHNCIAVVIGYSVGRLGRLGERASRSLSIETGIQNTGLGLVICFNFFSEISGVYIA